MFLQVGRDTSRVRSIVNTAVLFKMRGALDVKDVTVELKYTYARMNTLEVHTRLLASSRYSNNNNNNNIKDDVYGAVIMAEPLRE